MELPCVVHSDRLHHVMEGLSFSQRERLLECWALSLSPVEGIPFCLACLLQVKCKANAEPSSLELC